MWQLEGISHMWIFSNRLNNSVKCFMPNNSLEINPWRFSLVSWIILNLIAVIYMIENNQKELTTGSHPTTASPPQVFPLHIASGRFAIHATTGYPFSIPNNDNRVLSAMVFHCYDLFTFFLLSYLISDTGPLGHWT